MGSTGPMVVVVAKVIKVVHTDFKLVVLPRYKIVARPTGHSVTIPAKFEFIINYFETQKRSYKDEPVSFVALSGWPSETQFITFP